MHPTNTLNGHTRCAYQQGGAVEGTNIPDSYPARDAHGVCAVGDLNSVIGHGSRDVQAGAVGGGANISADQIGCDTQTCSVGGDLSSDNRQTRIASHLSSAAVAPTPRPAMVGVIPNESLLGGAWTGSGDHLAIGDHGQNVAVAPEDPADHAESGMVGGVLNIHDGQAVIDGHRSRAIVEQFPGHLERIPSSRADAGGRGRAGDDDQWTGVR